MPTVYEFTNSSSQNVRVQCWTSGWDTTLNINHFIGPLESHANIFYISTLNLLGHLSEISRRDLTVLVNVVLGDTFRCGNRTQMTTWVAFDACHIFLSFSISPLS